MAAAARAQGGGQDAETVQALRSNLARSFLLAKDLPLDPALRAAANDISAAHLARIGQLLPTWLQEERRLQTSSGEAADSGALYFAVLARLLNELALWQIEPGDPAYERATLAVLKTSPRVCETWGDPRFNDFSSRMLRVQDMPAAQQAAALDSERQLLAHWGQPRPAAEPWPDPLPQDAAALQIKRMQAGGQRPALALSPILAFGLLAQQKEFTALHPETQCALQQWWLRVSLQQGSTSAAALNAFRYGTLISAGDRLSGMFEPEAAEGAVAAVPAYPKLASRFDVAGLTTLRVQLDAAGQPRQASVTARKIQVRGIRGVRPIAFENTFDQLSLNYALKGRSYAKPSGTAPESFEMVWKLDTPAPAPPAPAANPGKAAAGTPTALPTGAAQ